MSVYRVPDKPTSYEDVEDDPFPTIRCRTCHRKTVSVCGEEDCAKCDLEWLMKGIDWQNPTRLLLGRTSFFGVP